MSAWVRASFRLYAILDLVWKPPRLAGKEQLKRAGGQRKPQPLVHAEWRFSNNIVA